MVDLEPGFCDVRGQKCPVPGYLAKFEAGDPEVCVGHLSDEEVRRGIVALTRGIASRGVCASGPDVQIVDRAETLAVHLCAHEHWTVMADVAEALSDADQDIKLVTSIDKVD